MVVSEIEIEVAIAGTNHSTVVGTVATHGTLQPQGITCNDEAIESPPSTFSFRHSLTYLILDMRIPGLAVIHPDTGRVINGMDAMIRIVRGAQNGSLVAP